MDIDDAVTGLQVVAVTSDLIRYAGEEPYRIGKVCPQSNSVELVGYGSVDAKEVQPIESEDNRKVREKERTRASQGTVIEIPLPPASSPPQPGDVMQDLLILDTHLNTALMRVQDPELVKAKQVVSRLMERFYGKDPGVGKRDP